MKEEKNIVVYIILTLVTCGIFGLVWFVQLTDDAKEYSGDTELSTGGMALLFTIITCGIYGIYWAYKMGKIMETAQSSNGLTAKDNSVLYLVLELFRFGIVNFCLIQSDLNEITRKKSGAKAQ